MVVYYNAYITGEYNALYTPTNHGFFHCSLTFVTSRSSTKNLLHLHEGRATLIWSIWQRHQMIRTRRRVVVSPTSWLAKLRARPWKRSETQKEPSSSNHRFSGVFTSSFFTSGGVMTRELGQTRINLKHRKKKGPIVCLFRVYNIRGWNKWPRLLIGFFFITPILGPPKTCTFVDVVWSDIFGSTDHHTPWN